MTLPATLAADARAVASARDARGTVGVVVTTFNHAHFLDAALSSIAAQTISPGAVIVVDDGSSDRPGEIVARYPRVTLIRQENRGLAAARNTGLVALHTDYVIFLDADDCLEPTAIQAALACFARMPDCGFVYGGHRYIDRDGLPIGERFEPPGSNPYLRLLRGNFIAMHATVMYRRDRLAEAGAFDPTLRRCEDYDVFLRMAKRYPVAGYADLVAAYRLHGENMSLDHRAMLDAALAVHARHRPTAADGAGARQAWKEGRHAWRAYYGGEMASARYRARRAGTSLAGSLPGLARLAAIAPSVAFREAARGARRRIGQILPRPVRDRLPRLFGDVPAPGRVRLGDLDGIMPIGRDFGFDRGTPIDRYYIERFLERHASEIGGRVLEVGGDDYTRRFGGTRVTHSDVLHVHPGNPRATIVGDLTDPSVLPEGAFDCIVLTQTLQLIYDVRLALAALHRALAPGGVLLVTVPGISQIDRGEWGDTWFWSFTPAALTRLFAESFGRRDVADFAVSADVADLADVADRADAAARVDHADDLIVEHHGNVFAATAFLQGLAVEEVDVRKLDHLDRAYPVIVAARARKKRG